MFLKRRSFQENTMACPQCGVRFTGTKAEMDEWLEKKEWDEEDGL